MTNRRPKAKKKTSKSREATQPTSSKVTLTIPARPAHEAATQSAASSGSQLSELSVVQSVTNTPVAEPLKDQPSPTPQSPPLHIPESDSDIVITPRPKTPPSASIRKKAFKNNDPKDLSISD